MLLSLNHKTLTADKLILEKKKKSSNRKKKTIINYARNIHVLRYTLRDVVKTYFVLLKSLKSVVSTLIQYLLDEDTFVIRIQCCVLEVL